MRYFPAVVALSLAFAFAGTANAGVVFGNFGADESGSVGITNNSVALGSTEIAVSFTPNGADLYLTEIKVAVGLESGSGSGVVDIMGSSSNVPDGTSIGSATFTAPATVGLTAATFSTPISLTAGDTYWAVVSATSGSFGWYLTSPSVSTQGYNASSWAAGSPNTAAYNTGGGWVASSSLDRSGISITAVPEPSTLALAGLGILAAGFVSRKRFIG